MSTVNDDGRQGPVADGLRRLKADNSDEPLTTTRVFEYLERLPGWWLAVLREMRTPYPAALPHDDLLPAMRYAPTGHWQATLQRSEQHIPGRPPVVATGGTPASAMLNALLEAVRRDEELGA